MTAEASAAAMGPTEPIRPTCPTCGAAFRGSSACGRCGTDLGRLTSLLLRAHELREEARRSLLADQPTAALECLAHARRLHDTEAGRRLEAVALIAADRPVEGVELAATLLRP